MTADSRALIAHAIGDYVVQSDWMAMEKTKSWWPAIAHGVTYTLPFTAITRDKRALALIAAGHVVIDHYRVARYVVWAKNLAAPARYRHPWNECSGTGYHRDRPDWMTVWLMIVADNVMHVLCNSVALNHSGGDGGTDGR